MVYIAVECIMGDLGWILIVCFLNLGLLVVDRVVFSVAASSIDVLPSFGSKLGRPPPPCGMI